LFSLIHKTVRARSAALIAAGLVLTLTSCNDPGPAEVNSAEMAGAGGRDISEYWQSIDVPLSQNTRMLSFEMLRSEVSRATGRSWVVGDVDQWDLHRGALGGADYVTTFADDLTPSQQRIVLIRKLAFQVCGDVVAAEAGAATRTVFTELDPGAAFDAGGDQVAAQIQALFRRFFIDDAATADVAEGVELLRALSPAGDDGKTAWRGLCVSYLASMRFLTY